MFTTSSGYAYDVDVIPFEVRWRSSDISLLETTPTLNGVSPPVTKVSFKLENPPNITRLLVQPRHVSRLDFSSGDFSSGDASPSEIIQSPPPETSGPSTDAPQRLPAGAVAGVVLGVLLSSFLIIAAVVFLFRRRRRERTNMENTHDGVLLETSDNLPNIMDGSMTGATGIAEEDSTPISPHTLFELPDSMTAAGQLGPVEIPDTSGQVLAVQELPSPTQPAYLDQSPPTQDQGIPLAQQSPNHPQ